MYDNFENFVAPCKLENGESLSEVILIFSVANECF